MARFDYELKLRTSRPLTPEELELIARVALDELARLCEVPDAAPRAVVHTRIVFEVDEPAKAA